LQTKLVTQRFGSASELSARTRLCKPPSIPVDFGGVEAAGLYSLGDISGDERYEIAPSQSQPRRR
jgi:hypothetical protein